MKRKFIIITLAISFFCNSSAHRTENPDNLINLSQKDMIISNRPVTNREYHIYINWLKHVYIDYPVVVIEALPKGSNSLFIDYIYGSITLEEYVYSNSELIRDYFYNPRYLDYPVIGLDIKQASYFCKWLSDRFNESSLIKSEYLRFDSTQVGESCFILESYLADMYMGLRNIDTVPKWNSDIYIPTFEVPDSTTLSDNIQILQREIKEYPFESNHFLNSCNQFYIESTDSILVYKSLYQNDTILNTNKYDFSKLELIELQDNLKVSLSKLDEDKLIMKDSLGRMPYLIAGVNEQEQILIYK